jgi:hypothetical protein
VRFHAIGRKEVCLAREDRYSAMPSQFKNSTVVAALSPCINILRQRVLKEVSMRDIGDAGRRRAIAIATAAVALAGFTAGCGTAPLSRAGGSDAAALAASHPVARELADGLLADVQWPSGVRRTRTSWPPTLILPYFGADAVSARVSYRIDMPFAGLSRFLATHKPNELLADGTGQLNRNGMITSRSADYRPRTLPSGIYEASLIEVIAPEPDGQSLISIGAQVTSYARRSAAEHIVAGRYRAVTITAPARNTGLSEPVTRTFSGRAAVTGFADLINGLHAAPDIAVNCGSVSDNTTYRLIFDPAVARWPTVAVSAIACPIAAVSVGGHEQPALSQDGAYLINAVRRLMGRTASGRNNN